VIAVSLLPAVLPAKYLQAILPVAAAQYKKQIPCNKPVTRIVVA